MTYELDDAAEQRAHDKDQPNRNPERKAVLENKKGKQRATDQAQVADGEVDHLRRAEGQHDPHGQQADDDAEDRAVEYHLGSNSTCRQHG